MAIEVTDATFNEVASVKFTIQFRQFCHHISSLSFLFHCCGHLGIQIPSLPYFGRIQIHQKVKNLYE